MGVTESNSLKSVNLVRRGKGGKERNRSNKENRLLSACFIHDDRMSRCEDSRNPKAHNGIFSDSAAETIADMMRTGVSK